MKDLTLTGPTREREMRYRNSGEARRHAALLAMANGNAAPAVMYQRQVEAAALVARENPVEDERLKRLEEKVDRLILLMEVQINGEKLHEVGGYSWGRASNGAAFVILYPAAEHLKHKVCRVYEEDFGKLPPTVNTAAIPDSAQEGNPDRDQAIRQRIYKPCPPFKIATREGKETQMGPEVRFSRTVEAGKAAVPKQEQPAEPPKTNGNGQQPGPAVKPSFFMKGDEVMVKGNTDEKAGTVAADEVAGQKVLVKVGKETYATQRERLTLIPKPAEQPELVKVATDYQQ